MTHSHITAELNTKAFQVMRLHCVNNGFEYTSMKSHRMIIDGVSTSQSIKLIALEKAILNNTKKAK